MDRPLIFIAALRRSGSTVLAETLTQLPDAFVFIEPELCRGHFAIRRPDIVRFAEVGVDLKAAVACHTPRGWRATARRLARFVSGGPPVMLAAFQAEFLPSLGDSLRQVGVKEISLDGWRYYLDLFPDARVLITGRDPRDIYLSLHDRVTAGRGLWRGPLTPERLADHLLAQFQHQLKICQATDCFRVSYERFCTVPNLLGQIKAFVQSPIPGTGQVGQFTGASLERAGEAALHGGQLSARRIARWTRETDLQRRAAAQETFDRMPAYCEFWGYQRDVPAGND